jgi:hypoxia up-regulated 1
LILHGGNTRVPFVQSAIKSVLGNDDKIAQNVNADEGAVLGAAYYGAALSRQFKMKKLEVKESSVREIQYYPEYEFEAAKTLFPKGTTLGTKKTLSFPAFGDKTLHFAEARAGYVNVRSFTPRANHSDQYCQCLSLTSKLL